MSKDKVSSRDFYSWGRYPRAPQSVRLATWRDELPPMLTANRGEATILPYGRGRSYGDVCLNSEGELLELARLDRIVGFDRSSGLITVEAGITLRQILEVVVPAGWFLPVTPGTSWVTAGGAIANDVHGKNHHRAGTFGSHIKSMELLRGGELHTLTSGSLISGQAGAEVESAPFSSAVLSSAGLFSATIGGLGLTGVIVTATLQLKPILDHRIVGDSIRFESLEEFFELSATSDAAFDYTVAWLDCLRPSGVRGLFMRGNHAIKRDDARSWKPRWERATVPMPVPGVFVKPWTMQCFNFAYYNKQQIKSVPIYQSFEPFFYPLDAVGGWNKLYGTKGFFQFQCVVPHAAGEPGIREVVEAARSSGAGSFLAVLKEFGNLPSPGMLSFPRAGYTLCLDFAHQGPRTIALMKRLEAIVMQHAGALYPAKDALMSRDTFERSYPRAQEFSRFLEPGFSSDFWRRVTA